MIETAEDVVNVILNTGEDQAEGEGVPSDAMVMVRLSETHLMLTVDSMEYDADTNTLWLNVSEF